MSVIEGLDKVYANHMPQIQGPLRQSQECIDLVNHVSYAGHMHVACAAVTTAQL